MPRSALQKHPQPHGAGEDLPATGDSAAAQLPQEGGDVGCLQVPFRQGPAPKNTDFIIELPCLQQFF